MIAMIVSLEFGVISGVELSIFLESALGWILCLHSEFRFVVEFLLNDPFFPDFNDFVVFKKSFLVAFLGDENLT